MAKNKVKEDAQQFDSGMSSSGRAAAEEAVRHFRETIGNGEHWYVALLGAVQLWTAPEEVYKGQHYKYLIADEAFDWLLLAERLCDSIDGLIPQEEEERLLFETRAPLELTPEEFKRLVGSAKYTALLNYWYGIDVEGALLDAVEEGIHKERLARGMTKRRDVGNEACGRVYGASKTDLLKEFLTEKEYEDNGTLSAMDLKEFTYWLFKYRVLRNDPARVASDTRRGIERLESIARQRSVKSAVPYEDPEKIIDLTSR